MGIDPGWISAIFTAVIALITGAVAVGAIRSKLNIVATDAEKIDKRITALETLVHELRLHLTEQKADFHERLATDRRINDDRFVRTAEYSPHFATINRRLDTMLEKLK